MYVCIYAEILYSLLIPIYIITAQSAGAVEYTDCVSTEGLRTPPDQGSWIWH